MKEAKEVYWSDLRKFAEVLGAKGFEPDRDLTELRLRLDLATVQIHIDRKAKGDFKQIQGRILLDFVGLGARGIRNVFEVKPFKGLSTIYVDECIAVARNIQTSFQAALAAAANQASLIDPKAIIAKEKEAVNVL